MKTGLLSNKVYSLKLFSGERVRGRSLLGTDIRVILTEKYFGQFAVPRWREYKERGKKELRYQRVPNIYLVFRQALKIMFGYGLAFSQGEKKKMRAVREAAKACNLAIISKEGGRIEEYQKILQEKRAEIFLLLGRARKPVKVEALIKAQGLETIYDSLDRVNLPSKRSIALAVGERAKKRGFEIDFIQPKIAARLWAAASGLNFAESTIDCALAAIRDLGWYLRRHPELKPEEREMIISRLVDEANNLKLIDFQPFLVNFRLSQAEIRQASQCIRQGKNKEALVFLRKAYFSLLYKQIQLQIEEIILQIGLGELSGKESGFSSLLSGLEKLKGKVSRINEEGFYRLAKVKVEKNLAKALEFLKEGEAKTAIQSLKKASTAMTWY